MKPPPRAGSPWLRYIDTYRGLPSAVWVLGLVVLVNRAGSMVLPFMSLYMTNILEAPAETVGRILTLYGAGALIGVTAGGWLVDNVAPRTMMVGSLVANALCFLLMRFIGDLSVLAAALFVTGIVGEAFRPANSAALVAAAPADKLQRAFALHQLSVNLGISIGATLGGTLAAISYSALFYVDAASCCVAGVLVAIAVSSVPKRPTQTSPASSGAVSVPFITFSVAYCVVAMLFTQFFVTATLYHEAYNHFSERQIGGLLAVNTLMITFLQMPVVSFLTGRPRWLLLAVGCAFFAAGFAILPYSSMYAIAVTSAGIWTVGEMLLLPAISAQTAAMAPHGQMGRYIGITTAAFTVGRMVAPLVGTLVYDRAGPTVLWLSSAALALVLAVFYVAHERMLSRALPRRDV